MAQSRVAEVRLHGKHVGELSYDRGGSTFRYEDDLTDPHHKVLGQIFEDDPRAVRRERVGIPSWFANLLPEGEMRRQVVQDLGGGNVGEFAILAHLGKYLPGAVTVNLDGDLPPGIDIERKIGAPSHELRHSQAGVQLKYTVRRLTFPASGDGGWWTAKLPDRSLRQLGANEYLTMKWLAAADYPVPTVQLVPASAVGGLPDGLVDSDEPVYLIERFDRSAEGNVHFEDFAQVADVPPEDKYGQQEQTYDTLADVVNILTGEAGYHDFVRRLTAMLVTGNVDAHLKNWAFIYRDGRTPELAPVYDFHSLTVYQPYRYTPLALSFNGKHLSPEVSLDDFRYLAEHANADPEATVEYVREAVEQLRTSWEAGCRVESSNLFPALAEHYDQRLKTLPITRT